MLRFDGIFSLIFSELLNTINEFMIFKEELQSTLCCQDNSSLCHETSRDTWKTFGTGTTLPCPPRSPTSVSLPLPPEVSPSWLPNPCSDVDSTTSAPALTSQNYLRLLSKASKEYCAIAGVILQSPLVRQTLSVLRDEILCFL